MKNKNKFLLILMSVFFMMTQGLYAQVNNVTKSTSHGTLQDAITHANGGDLLMLTADLNLGTATHTINKPLIIDGDGHEIKLGANAKNIRFEAASNGSVVKNVNFLKTVQEKTFMIYIAADNLTFDNNTYTGQKSGFLNSTKENKVFEVGYNKENLVFKNSTFKDMHMIAYVNGKSKGAILNNTYSNTSGWNLTYNTAFEIEGNTWNSLFANFVNIIGDGASTDPQENFYTCRIDMMVAENTVPKFTIENLVTGKTCAITNVTKSTDWEDMETAIAYAQADDELRLNKDITQTETIVLNKKLTINQDNWTITTNGGNYVYKLVPNNSHGTTIKNGKISKTDHQTQQLIFVQANDVTIDNIDFEGVYDENVDPGEVSRGFEVVGNLNNLVIQNSSFKNLRQPGYINPKTTGQILNNHVEGTRGWVMVANTEFNFDGNTWTDNARDISFIDDVPAVDPSENYYTCSKIRAIKHFNNDPTIGNELLIGDCTGMFITEWVTNDGQVIIPTEGTGYNYDITWTNMTNPTNGDGSAIGQTGNFMINGLTNGDTYEIAITGDFPRIYFNNSGDKNKIRKVTQWGDIEWTSMEKAFYGAKNLEVTAMDTPNLTSVTNMSYMFAHCTALDGTLNGNWGWNTEYITNLSLMFWNANNFNADISNWNTGNVTNMNNMFYVASSFNIDISSWNTENVISMSNMFNAANAFNQNLGAWDISSLANARNMFNSTNAHLGIDCDNLSATLKGWALNPNTPNGIELGALNRQVSNVGNLIDVTYLVDIKGWTISGLIAGCDTWDESSTFVTEWVSNDGTITIPTLGSGYDYTILWTNLTSPGINHAVRAYGNHTIIGLTPGDTYEVQISGDFPRIYFKGLPQVDRNKITAVTQWGNNEWTTMANAFEGASKLDILAGDTPNLSSATSMSYMFAHCTALDGTLNGNWGWNTEYITNLSLMFWNTNNFNADISNWNTGNVTNMSNMFYVASSFNIDISSWNTENVISMSNMFNNAHAFNQNLGAWDLSNLENANGMFNNPGLNRGIDCDNLSLTLEGWKNGATAPDDINLGLNNRQVTEDAMTNTLTYFTNKGWTMNGLSGTACDVIAASGFESLVEEAQLDISVYPNPTSGVFTLASEQGKDYVVMDIYGRTILQNKITDSKTVIDLSAYPRGMYYVQVGEQVARIVLK